MDKVIIKGYDLRENELIVEINYNEFNAVYQAALEKVTENRGGSNTNYINSDEMEAEIEAIHSLTCIDTSKIYDCKVV